MRNENNDNKDLIILVPSWDGAKELWIPFSTCISRNWSSCPYNIVLLTQSQVELNESIFANIITSDTEANNPVERIRRAVDVLDYEYIMLLLDDYFCYKPIFPDVLEKHISFMQNMNIDYLDFDHKSGISLYKEKNKGSLFYISTGAPCVFSKRFLLFILDNINAHSMREFEVFATSFLNDCVETYQVYTCTNSNMFFMHGVLEGYWRRSAMKIMKNNKIVIEYNTYKRSTILRTVKTCIKAFVFNIIRFLLPEALRHYYATSSQWTCKYN